MNHAYWKDLSCHDYHYGHVFNWMKNNFWMKIEINHVLWKDLLWQDFHYWNVFDSCYYSCENCRAVFAPRQELLPCQPQGWGQTPWQCLVSVVCRDLLAAAVSCQLLFGIQAGYVLTNGLLCLCLGQVFLRQQILHITATATATATSSSREGLPILYFVVSLIHHFPPPKWAVVTSNIIFCGRRVGVSGNCDLECGTTAWVLCNLWNEV